MLDHESQEERKEDWISKLFRLSEGPLADSPASNRATPRRKSKKGKGNGKKRKNNKVLPVLPPHRILHCWPWT